MLRYAIIAVLFAAIFVASGPAVALAGICAESAVTAVDPCCCPQDDDACASETKSLAIPDCCVTEAPPAVPPVPVTHTQVSAPTPVFFILNSAAYTMDTVKASEVVPSRQVSTPADLSASTVLRC